MLRNQFLYYIHNINPQDTCVYKVDKRKPHYHLYCQECNTISEFESSEIHNLFLSSLENINFKPTNFNVIINGVCNKCQK